VSRSYCKVCIAQIKLECLDYYVDSTKLEVGQIVRVPFRSKEKIGLIIAINDVSTIDDAKLKSIIEVIDFGTLPVRFIDFLQAAARYYFQPLNNFVKLAIPGDDLFDNYRSKGIAPDRTSHDQVILTYEQQSAYEHLQQKFDENTYNVVLLDGVTGSGKTEVYLNLVAKHLASSTGDKQVLILLPEIALTKQLIDKIKSRLSVTAAVWHSSTSKSDKKKIYRGIIGGSVRLIIGARSSLFLPYKNLGLIVVDEEHDGSYKQDENIIYNARDMAVYRAFYEKFMVVLVSATPSIETIQNVIDQKYGVVKISSRFGVQSLPEFKIIDMKAEVMPYDSAISPSLKYEIAATVKDGKQALLYLNRRGYAPLMICASCGFKLTCPGCSTWLVEHRLENKLKCHHCNYTKTNRGICPSCKNSGCIRSCGVGVEKVAEELAHIFPNEKIVIITRDTMSSIEKVESIISQIKNNEVSLIVGTQMVAKGHHFPHLTMVGIIDADIGFGGADLRATERTYQLLEQVSGRSGREVPGRVVIQTYNIESRLLSYIVKNDRESFIQEEIHLRKLFALPPFTRLIHILVTAKKEEVTRSFAQKICSAAPKVKGVEIFGATPAYLVRLKDKYRYQILIKCSKSFDYHRYLTKWLSLVSPPSYISIKIDIDPYNFV